MRKRGEGIVFFLLQGGGGRIFKVSENKLPSKVSNHPWSFMVICKTIKIQLNLIFFLLP